MDVQAIQDKFANIQFDEPTHTYRVDGKIVPSVSSVISRYKPPFNRTYWLNYKSKALGTTPEKLGKVWDEKRDTACALGHHWHTYVEQRLLGVPPTVQPIASIDRFLEQDNSKTLFCELRMGNKYLCGTLDNLIERDGQLIIRDWKTNKRFRKDSRFKLLPPFHKIPNTEYYIYTIQLNLYYRLLGIKEAKLEIVWFDRQNDTWEVIPLPIRNDISNHIIRELYENYDHRETHISNTSVAS